MGMPRGLAKSTGFYQTIEAWKDWEKIAAQHPDIARRFVPKLNAGWRSIDKAIAKVRAAAEEEKEESENVK